MAELKLTGRLRLSPMCWQGFIEMLRNEPAIQRVSGGFSPETINKYLRLYNAVYTRPGCVNFESEEDLVIFKLKFGL